MLLAFWTFGCLSLARCRSMLVKSLGVTMRTSGAGVRVAGAILAGEVEVLPWRM